MRWLKHMTDTTQDEKVAELISKAGHAGYGLWWMVLETIAAGMDKSSEKCSLKYPISKWAAELQTPPQNLCRSLAVIGAVGLLEIRRDGAMLELSAPNLLKYRDEYSRKSGHSPDNVRSKQQIQNTDTDTDNTNPSAADAATGALFAVDKEKPEVTTLQIQERHDYWYETAFWNRKGRADSARAYHKRVRILMAKGMDLDQASAFLKRQAIEDQERFRPTQDWEWRQNLHPATWLNGARWEDQPRAREPSVAPKRLSATEEARLLIRKEMEGNVGA